MEPPFAIPLDRSRADAAAQLIGRAFFDDPMFVFGIPDEAERRRALPVFVGIGVLGRLDDGEVWATSDGLSGVAVWRPPGWQPGSSAAAAQLRREFVEATSEVSRARLGVVMQSLSEGSELAFGANPGWYLAMLAVEPERQGRGIGGRIIANVLRHADEATQPCTLETFKPKNVEFYEKHGFEVARSWHIPEGGPRVWAMRREPQPRTATGEKQEAR